MKATSLISLACMVGLMASSAVAWQSDDGDGTFTNPPLYADYPDPDIIRVGDDFYLTTTTFADVPVITILHSQDLVNWEFTSHVVPRLEGKEQYDLKNGNAYRSGLFATSLRQRDGTFYIVVTPVGQNTRVYSARNIHGPWSVHELDRAAFDPGFFIDTDGTGYIATSGGWDGHVTLLKLNANYSQVVDATKIHYIPGAEGSHLVKRGEYYYLFNAIPRRLAMTVSRAKALEGPWETRAQISDRTGGHQGAIVDLPDGRSFGFAMKDCGAVGRMTNISPIFWQDDWPVWGAPDAPGKIPDKATKPIAGKPLVQPATSDEFDSPALGLQWQWNHNPDDARWSLTERPGFLRLRPTMANDFWTARNTLVQKGQGPWSRGEIKMDLSHLASGDICGFGTLGKFNGHIAVTCGDDGRFTLSMNVIEDAGKTETRVAVEPIDAKELFLRTDLDFIRSRGACSYSVDGTRWTRLGGEFPLAFDWRTGTFQGEQFAIFCFNRSLGAPSDGFVDVDWFHFAVKQ
jgi:beta-xylosidase